MTYYTESGKKIFNPNAYAQTGAPMYNTDGIDINQKTYLYVINLKYGKKYIGKTTNIEKRINDHFNGNGSQVTKKNDLIDYEILETVPGYFGSEKEQEYTEQYIEKYGYSNVRGGKYTNSKTMSIKGTCYRCGREGHYATNCYAKTNVNGESLS